VDADADRRVHGDALRSLDVLGATYVMSSERASQERSRVLRPAGSHHVPELRVEQLLGGNTSLVWVSRDARHLPCERAAHLELERACGENAVVAVVESDIAQEFAWGSGKESSVAVATVAFQGLSISGENTSVVLRSSATEFDVSFSVGGNDLSSPAFHRTAVKVWRHLLHRLMGDEAIRHCSVDAPPHSVTLV